MGDRVSIQFKYRSQTSVALFDHWGGVALPREALEYAVKLAFEAKARAFGIGSGPMARLEPDTVIVDFIRHLTREDVGRVSRSLYLGRDEHDGDNSDNGNFVVLLDKDPPVLDREPGAEDDGS